jgi:hypothetical protein
MTQMLSVSAASPDIEMHASAAHVLRRTIVIGLTAFLPLVGLFATPAILPSLAKAYHVTPAAMGLAVNASTLGMAVAGLAVGLFSWNDRRRGILLSLAPLSILTASLTWAPDLTSFALLRITQGLFMSSAFALTLAYLGEAAVPRTRAARSLPTSPAMSQAPHSGCRPPEPVGDVTYDRARDHRRQAGQQALPGVEIESALAGRPRASGRRRTRGVSGRRLSGAARGSDRARLGHRNLDRRH